MHSNHRDAGTLCVKSYRVKKKKIYILIFLGGNKLSYLLHEWFPQFDANLWRQLQPVWIKQSAEEKTRLFIL